MLDVSLVCGRMLAGIGCSDQEKEVAATESTARSGLSAALHAHLEEVMKRIRFKADFTVEAESIDDVKREFAKYLLDKKNDFGPSLNCDDGWCCGFEDSFHYAESCWGM